jgi:hypothetical protein
MISLIRRHSNSPNCSAALYPDPKVKLPNYPEGFQGVQIPVHGPLVAKLIEDRADGLLP